MLRDLAFDGCRELHVLFKRGDEMLHISEPTHGTEAAACFVQRGPIQRITISPSRQRFTFRV